MTLRSTLWRGGLPRAVVLAVVTALVPAPALAAGDPPQPGPGGLRAAVRNVPAGDPATSRTARTGARAAQGTAGQSASFFKSKPGIVALAVMIAGTGYAIYSTQNDRIKSPGAK